VNRNLILKTASIISIAGNMILAALKITTGFYAGSFAVFGDGLDSLTDVLVSFITLYISILISQVPDRTHPYGHHRAETIGTSILAFIIFFTGGQLAVVTVEKLLNHDAIPMPDTIALYVVAVSIAGKILLAWSQYAFGRKIESNLLIANGRNMLNDVLMSAGVLAGLGFTFLLELPVIDRVIAIIIGLYIMVSAARILMGTVTELMEGEGNRDVYNRIFAAVTRIQGVANPHRVRIRKLGALYAIDLDIELDGALSVNEAHARAKKVEMAIRADIPNIYDIVIHVEPIGNVEADERYGLTKKDME
jgi:cation diffusion facilitator family transporter